MIYLQKNRKSEKKYKKTKWLFVIVLVIALLMFGDRARGVFQFLSTPINSIQNIISYPFKNMISYFAFKNSLYKNNLELLEENKRIKIELLTIESLNREISDLRNQLRYVEEKPQKILAKVIYGYRQSVYDTFSINLPEDKSENGLVVYYENIPIGTIKEIYKNTSVVQLYSSTGTQIQVGIGENKGFEAVGQSDGRFKVSIPKDIKINIGDPVYLGELIIGLVGGIEFEDSNTFQNVFFSYPIKPGDINYVWVSQKTTI